MEGKTCSGLTNADQSFEDNISAWRRHETIMVSLRGEALI